MFMDSFCDRVRPVGVGMNGSNHGSFSDTIPIISLSRDGLRVSDRPFLRLFLPLHEPVSIRTVRSHFSCTESDKSNNQKLTQYPNWFSIAPQRRRRYTRAA